MIKPDLEIPVFSVSLQKSSILIPNASVAEIIPYEPLQRVPDTPDWFLGFLGWRGVQVAVVSLEMLTQKRASFSLVSVSSASIVILRAISGEDDFKYLAIVAQSLPRLIRVTPDELFETGDSVERTELIKARYGDEVFAIPDIDFVESEIRRVAYISPQ
ncbi:MAG: chemosensory pili system protein ChpC [Candidatus Azotimanducaceae bacterium]|jgi:chemosensory pili system protein ChpC